MTESAAQRLIEVLRGEGFTTSLVGSGLRAAGAVSVRGQDVVLHLEYPDLTLSDTPRFYVPSPASLGRPVFPHLDESGELCVVDRAAYVHDRYHAPEQVLGLIKQAARVLEAGSTKGSTEEIAKEFPQHWGGGILNADLTTCTGSIEVFIRNSLTWAAVKEVKPRDRTTDGVVVTTQAELSFSPSQARPESLEQALNWAAAWDKKLATDILQGLRSLSAKDPFCLIRAPNGIVGFQLLISKMGGPRQVEALGRQGGWPALVSTPAVQRAPIQRYQVRLVDMPSILGRDETDAPPLAGKDIVLVGCGSIGGFLAQALARMGAGLDGRLMLVDPDLLEPTNIGRHFLGAPEVGLAKAGGCEKIIKLQLPHINVIGRQARIQDLRLAALRADIIIDATGEDSVGELLNDWILTEPGTRRPKLLHVWIEGHGSAVRSFVSSDPDFGCLRCLHPDPEHEPRYRALKSDAPTDLRQGCGGTTYTPYGPSAPILAAGLACRNASELAKGSGRPLLRQIQIDYEATNFLRPINPPRAPSCPACSHLPRA